MKMIFLKLSVILSWCCVYTMQRDFLGGGGFKVEFDRSPDGPFYDRNRDPKLASGGIGSITYFRCPIKEVEIFQYSPRETLNEFLLAISDGGRIGRLSLDLSPPRRGSLSIAHAPKLRNLQSIEINDLNKQSDREYLYLLQVAKDSLRWVDLFNLDYSPELDPFLPLFLTGIGSLEILRLSGHQSEKFVQSYAELEEGMSPIERLAIVRLPDRWNSPVFGKLLTLSLDFANSNDLCKLSEMLKLRSLRVREYTFDGNTCNQFPSSLRKLFFDKVIIHDTDSFASQLDALSKSGIKVEFDQMQVSYGDMEKVKLTLISNEEIIDRFESIRIN